MPVLGAIFLRHAAERLRALALKDLYQARLGSFTNWLKRQMIDEVIPEIRALKKGAFAALTEQPFIRAIVLPSGSLGLLAVAQRLFDLF